jgi:uncharacterized protein (DUF58 family)
VDVTLLLDLDPRAQAGQGEESTEEYGVTITASIAAYLLRQKQLAVGLVVSGMPDGRLQLDRGERQLDRVLELLAVAHPREETPVSEALALEAVHLARSSVLVLVTASTDLVWPEGVHHLLQRGVRPLVISLDPASFDPAIGGNHYVLEALTATGVQALTVRCGDNLAAVLSASAAPAVRV